MRALAEQERGERGAGVAQHRAARQREREQVGPGQPLLLQGDAGFSRKGPQPQQASNYNS